MPNQVNLKKYHTSLLWWSWTNSQEICYLIWVVLSAWRPATPYILTWFDQRFNIYVFLVYCIQCLLYIYNSGWYNIYHTNLTAQRASYLKILGYLHNKFSLSENLYDWNNNTFLFLVFCTSYHDQCWQHQLKGWILHWCTYDESLANEHWIFG